MRVRNAIAARALLPSSADEEGVTTEEAARKTPAKARELLTLGAGRRPAIAGLQAEFAWCGAFGLADDSLPFIGPVPGKPGCFAAYGYGGNGITFSALAAELLADWIEGRDGPMAAFCALNRS